MTGRGRGRGRGHRPAGGTGKAPMREPRTDTVAKVLQDAESDQFSDAQTGNQPSSEVPQSQEPRLPETPSPQPPQRSDNRSQVDEDEKPQEEKRLHSSELVGQLKSALKEGAKVVTSPGLNPHSPEFTPSSSSSSLNPTAQPFTPTQLNPHSPEFSPSGLNSTLIVKTPLITPQLQYAKPSQPGSPRSLSAAAPEFVPKVGLPLAMQNGDQPPPSDRGENGDFYVLPEEELQVLKVDDILRGFEMVTRPSRDDDGGEMVLTSSAEMLLKGTMYPASYDRLKKRLQTTIKAWPPSRATLTNLAEMLVHWGILEPGLRYTASRMCETLSSDPDMSTGGFRAQLVSRLQSSYKKYQQQPGMAAEKQDNLINLALFFADVFARIKVAEKPVAVLGNAIFDLISLLLSIKEDSTVMGACNVLKLTGSLLESCEKTPERMDVIMSTLRRLASETPTPLSSRCIELMLLVLELRACDWGSPPFRTPPSQPGKTPFLSLQPPPADDEVDFFEFVPPMLQAPVTNPEDWIEFLDDSGAIIEETDTAGFVPPAADDEEEGDEGLDPEIQEAMEAFLDELDREEMLQEFCPEEEGDGGGGEK